MLYYANVCPFHLTDTHAHTHIFISIVRIKTSKANTPLLLDASSSHFMVSLWKFIFFSLLEWITTGWSDYFLWNSEFVTTSLTAGLWQYKNKTRFKSSVSFSSILSVICVGAELVGLYFTMLSFLFSKKKKKNIISLPDTFLGAMLYLQKTIVLTKWS